MPHGGTTIHVHGHCRTEIYKAANKGAEIGQSTRPIVSPMAVSINNVSSTRYEDKSMRGENSSLIFLTRYRTKFRGFLGEARGAVSPQGPTRGQTRPTATPAMTAAHAGEKPMEAMREETQAEEPQIGQERAQSEARLGALAVLQRRMRELLPTLPPAVALGHQAPVRDALAVMRQKQLSCVLVVERGQLVGVFTERDVVTKVVATPLDVDHV